MVLVTGPPEIDTGVRGPRRIARRGVAVDL
jgi:hypothetical protein